MMPLTPWVKRLLIANVVVFLLSAVVPAVYRLGMLVPAAALFRPWTLLTYMFLHAGFGHIFFNMLGLVFFGPRLEDRLGSADFLKLYLWGGIGGAVLSFVFAPEYAVVGASAAVYAVLMGFAVFWPRERVYIYGILPVEAWLLVGGFVVLSIMLGVGGDRSGTAHFAHLGGLVTGFVFLRWRDWRRGAARREFRRKVQESPSPAVTERAALERWGAIDTRVLHELNRLEVEALLAKARALGVRSLSLAERAFLDRMSTRH